MNDSDQILMAPVERLVFFSDAAVAIALTLLILPLMDGVSQAAEANLGALGYLSHNANALLSFVLSFVIIARFWRAHHGLFSHVEREVPGLFWLNMAWLGAIVLLPVATAMTGSLQADRIEYSIYMGTMLAASVLLTAMTWLLARHPEAWTEGHRIGTDQVRTGVSIAIMLVISLFIALLVPGAGYWSLLMLFGARYLHLLLDRLLDGPRTNPKTPPAQDDAP